ncbi:hypothetical protein EYR38_010501 [Pleurotus pulmonarius]|nr:hypothetical protein EYR38_010501 [Pleurotus pulmonarius]
MTSIVPGKYGDIGSLDVVEIAFQIAKLPIILVSSLIFSPFVWYNKHKTWRRVLGDQAFRWAAGLKVPQLQSLMGTTLATYRSTVAKLNLPAVEEDIGSNARLLWLGPKQTEHVLLYLHGGAFLGPSTDAAFYFWRHVQEQLKARSNVDLGVVILAYTLIPEAAFPTPLRQSVAAINHLTSQGVKPENIHLAGDSAGGNLIFQVLLHALYPIESVAPLKLSKPLRGAYTISPWVSLTADSESTFKHANSDIITPKNLREWGGYVLADVPVGQRGYVEALKAPDDWFKNIHEVVDRILITAGGQECLRDDILAFNEKLKKTYKGKLDFVLQRGGVHNDIFLDFLVNETKLGELTPMIIEWLAAGYE